MDQLFLLFQNGAKVHQMGAAPAIIGHCYDRRAQRARLKSKSFFLNISFYTRSDHRSAHMLDRGFQFHEYYKQKIFIDTLELIKH